MLDQGFHCSGDGLLACRGVIEAFPNYETSEILGDAADGTSGAKRGFRVTHYPKVLNNIL